MEKATDIGKVLDKKYRLERLIGIGGMGRVYEATHLVIGRRVAIKTIDPFWIGDDRVITRFHREARHAGSLDHDHICEVTDLGRAEDGRPYLVMELLRGRSLDQIFKEESLLHVDRAVSIICQTLSALEAAHAERIVHRDLKPDNIFITRVGTQDNFVKLLDFGISKLLDDDRAVSVTRSGVIIGTPLYMAPEQAHGSKDIDHRVDIYAVGVILYEALTGRRPFDGDTPTEVLSKILLMQFAAPSTYDKTIPRSIEQVILTAMAPDPAQRFESAEQMRQVLELAATCDRESLPAELLNVTAAERESREVFTPTETAFERVATSGITGRFSRRGLALFATGIVLALAVLAFVLWRTVFVDDSLPDTAEPQAQLSESDDDQTKGPAKTPELRSAALASKGAAEPVTSDAAVQAEPDSGVVADASVPKTPAKVSAPTEPAEPKKKAAKPKKKAAKPSKPTPESSDGKVLKGPFDTKIITDFGE